MGLLRRKKNKKKKAKAEQDVRMRAKELKGQAKELADASAPAMKDFASTTGTAAREFAHTAFAAAKDLVETVERAGEQLDASKKPKRRKGRTFLKATLLVGAGAALFKNDTVRNAISSRFQGFGGEPAPWDAAASAGSGNGEFSQAPVSQTTP